MLRPSEVTGNYFRFNIFCLEQHTWSRRSITVIIRVLMTIIKYILPTIYVHMWNNSNIPEDIPVVVNFMKVYMTDNPPILEPLVNVSCLFLHHN